MDVIPYIIHESEMARQERTTKRLWILCIIIFAALIATNAGWIWYESQWQDEVITQEIDQDSGDGGENLYRGNIIGGDYYGKTESENNGAEENP